MVEVYIGVLVRMFQVYAWGGLMHLLTEEWQFPKMNFHGLVHMWLVGDSKQTILPFSIFQDGRVLENFSGG